MSDSGFCSEGFVTGTRHFGAVTEHRKGIKVSGQRDKPFTTTTIIFKFSTYLFFCFGPKHSIEIVISAILLFFCCCQLLPTKVGNSA